MHVSTIFSPPFSPRIWSPTNSQPPVSSPKSYDIYYLGRVKANKLPPAHVKLTASSQSAALAVSQSSITQKKSLSAPVPHLNYDLAMIRQMLFYCATQEPVQTISLTCSCSLCSFRRVCFHFCACYYISFQSFYCWILKHI